MKATFMAAAAAAMVGGVSAGHRHDEMHNLFAKKGLNDSGICTPGCTTIWTTITGPAGLYTPPPAPVNTTATPVIAIISTSAPTTTKAPTSTSSPPATVPTLQAQTCATTGVYTFPASTIVVTETEVVCGASTTAVPSGTHTLGGVTTVVETATTVVCPYATTSTTNGVVTSVIETTTYVCPSAGTYTIAPITTVVVETTATVAVPCVETYTPGTYTAPSVVTTVTETDYVVYCPFTAQEASTSTSAAVVVPVPVPATTSTTAAAVAVATTSSSSSTSGSNSGGLGSSGNQWAITYTPYTESGECKSASDVMADMTSIKAAGFSSVRVYSTDCSTLENVGTACASAGLKMIIGIFISEVGCDNASPHVSDQIEAIKAWAQWDLVELLVVGNEALFNEYCTVAELTSLISTVKSTLGAAGYTGPYTTTDVVSAWQENDVSSLCDEIDVVACNAHAYFNTATLPEAAGPFVAGQLAIVEGICGKKGYVLETGWPTQGDCFGVACPSVSNQATALASIKDTCGGDVAFFTFGLDMWKDAGSCNCEPYFDCKDFFTALAS